MYSIVCSVNGNCVFSKDALSRGESLRFLSWLGGQGSQGVSCVFEWEDGDLFMRDDLSHIAAWARLDVRS